MNKYSKCPQCGRTSTGLDVYECKNCGRIWCYYDGTFGIGSTGCWSSSGCPGCGKMRSEAPIVKIGDVVSSS